VLEGTKISVTRTHVYLAGASKDIQIYDMPTQAYEEFDFRKLPPEAPTLKAHEIMSTAIAGSPDGSFLASGSADGCLLVFDATE
jgi:WD40 repeat protein